ncbi:MAG: hypothetical protein KKB91_06045 [Proteobacteria bacterium]|jgi:predicted house-cleaning noncanonical NTP pyrophosphatase (MazG superfamily)|nr:hypothetical protein [Desulfocapsa sp.]MBU3945982.1 hypothetical protein [Pseudomonadota bacterium]MCG2742563.1 hypothetical protein [Desulfobacteraceae bacterium]MBU3982822.1 hypothetical protein [Pseudomonadota bacterium]MBU4029954.1 hypothetical protein [Pseudomonadota bacterium]
MAEIIPEDIQKDLEKACSLHQRTSSDYKKCMEFNKLMSELLGRLEDADCYRAADRVMGILLDCNPREGAHCDKVSMVGEKVKKFEKG